MERAITENTYTIPLKNKTILYTYPHTRTNADLRYKLSIYVSCAIKYVSTA